MLKRSNVITNKSIIITPFVLIIETIKKLSTVSLKKRRFPSRVYDCYRIRWNVGEITRADANNVYIFANAPAESISNNHSRRPIAECEDLIDWNSIGIRLEFDFQCSKCRKQLCNAAIACVFLLSQMKILFWCQYRYANPNFPKFHPQFTLVAAVSLSLSLSLYLSISKTRKSDVREPDTESQKAKHIFDRSYSLAPARRLMWLPFWLNTLTCPLRVLIISSLGIAYVHPQMRTFCCPPPPTSPYFTRCTKPYKVQSFLMATAAVARNGKIIPARNHCSTTSHALEPTRTRLWHGSELGSIVFPFPSTLVSPSQKRARARRYPRYLWFMNIFVREYDLIL